MNGQFKSNSIALALALAFPGFVLPAWATEPYPALPPTLSTSVTPNVMLHIDNSISMDGKVNNKKKIDTAKSVATTLVTGNAGLRWGIFSFDKNKGTMSGVLGAPIGSSTADLTTAIANLGADTYTPLGETLFEITQYFSGGTSFYGKTTSKWNNPIQYRCQKNFAIIITDGDATKDDELPGVKCSSSECSSTTTRAKPTYTSYTYNETTKLYSPVTKTFGVCTKAYTDATTAITPGITATGVSCPEKLENESLQDSATSHPFLTTDTANTKSYTASIRDVAAYAFDKDFKVGGVDLDGQSFDDQKFIKQNLRTYTVGFGVNNAVLPAAAAVGRGKFYTADPGNEQYLTDALNNAVNDILANSSNAGGVASMGDVTGLGNWIFQPVFNPKDWYGELRCFSSVDSSGNGVSCSPNGKARFPAHASRKIYSAKVTVTPPSTIATTSVFDFTSANANATTPVQVMTTGQRTSLGGTSAERTNLVNFLRGQEGLTGFRVRPKDANGNTILLGDIIDAQPVVLAAPIGTSSDTTYATFQTTNAARSIVFIGANDGMLHAFDIGTPTASSMLELMAYVPSAVYPHLKALKEKNYGASAGTPHTYHVNGTAQSLDVKIGGSWKTLLAGGLGQGGQGYYTIDATNAATLGTNASVKWEWTDASDPNMGFSFGKPIIYNVRKDATSSQPAVILSNGYDNDYADGITSANDTPAGTGKTSALYIVNANDGTLIKRILVPASAASDGLSSPAGVDFGQDGVLDYVYAGDMSGKLWRFDLTDSDPSNFKVVDTPIFDAGPGHPISYRPSILAVNDSSGDPMGNLVLFGTGKLLTDSDRADTTVQSFYAVLDKMDSAPSTVPKSSLLQQTVTETVTPAVLAGTRPGTYRKVSRNEFDAGDTLTFDLTKPTENLRGWYMDFPVESERLVTSPLLIDDKLVFGTGIPKSDEKCLPGGKGWVMGLNPLTGSVVRTARGKGEKGYSFLDIYLDGKATDADKVLFSSGLGFISGYQKLGIPTELSYTTSSQKIGNPNTTGTSLGAWGSGIAMRNVNYLGVYMANAAEGTTRGNSIPVPGASGGGKIYSPTIGQDKVDNDDFNGPPAEGYKLQATTWREIK